MSVFSSDAVRAFRSAEEERRRRQQNQQQVAAPTQPSPAAPRPSSNPIVAGLQRVGGAARMVRTAGAVAGMAAEDARRRLSAPLLGRQRPPASSASPAEGALQTLGVTPSAAPTSPPRQASAVEDARRRTSELVGPTLAQRSTMGPNEGPQPAAAPAAAGATGPELATTRRRLEEERNSLRRAALVGLSPGFTAEDAARADAMAANRNQLRDVAMLQREPREARPASAIEESRNRLRETGRTFAREQLERTIGPDRLRMIEAGVPVDMTPEERAAIEEFDRITGGLQRNLPAISADEAATMAEAERGRIGAANERLAAQQASLTAPGGTFAVDQARRSDEREIQRRMTQLAMAELDAQTAQAQQVGREAGGTNPTGSLSLAELEENAARAQAEINQPTLANSTSQRLALEIPSALTGAESLNPTERIKSLSEAASRIRQLSELWPTLTDAQRAQVASSIQTSLAQQGFSLNNQPGMMRNIIAQMMSPNLGAALPALENNVRQMLRELLQGQSQ